MSRSGQPTSHKRKLGCPFVLARNLLLLAKTNMPTRIHTLLRFSFIIALLAVVVALVIKNYTPNTYLIGWDSLNPEFNFQEAFRRVTDGVFRAEQGLGAVAAHSHMADAPRLIFLWLTSLVLPASILRYSYIFLCLFLGPLGVFMLLEYVFGTEKESKWNYPAAFLGALFYLLNLSTLQNFYVPFEMFPAAFAFAPWLMFSGLKYLREGGRGHLIFWAVALIVSSPMAYAATLWYATFAGLFIFFLFFAIISSAKKTKFKRLFVLGIFAVLLNSYWILPNFYSIATQSKTISDSNINRIFSPEAFLRNRDYGTPGDILLQKNFLFAWRNFDFANNQFGDLLAVWENYLGNPNVLLTGYILSGISVLGLLWGIVKREKVSLAVFPALLFVLFFLLNINPPAGNFYSYLYNHFNIFAEGFRMPFTKFSILYQLFAAFYFGYFVFAILTLRPRILAIFKVIIFGGITVGLMYFMLPVFSGNLIGQNVRREFPGEYRELFDWFNSHESGRVALFPINSKYGWEYRNWGYEGSGFLTYGTSNPMLYRDFDRWNVANEDFFNQESFALYSNDADTFVNTLKKYQVKYLLIDESIINPGGSDNILKINQIKNIFSGNPEIHQVASFGFLTVYETSFSGSNNDVKAPSKFTLAGPVLNYSATDPIYKTYGDYIDLLGGVTYPFVNLDKRNGVKIDAKDNILTFFDSATWAKIQMSIKDPTLENLSVNRGFSSAYNCDLMKVGRVFKSNSVSGIIYRAEGGGASCDFLSYPALKYNQAYVLRVAGENKEGRSLKIYLFNQMSQIPDLEEILPPGNFDENFFVYPKTASGSGYILNLETRSFGRIASENVLSKVQIYPVDYKALSGVFAGSATPADNGLKVNSVKKYGKWAFKADVEGSGLIQLSQGFDGGWVGFTVKDGYLQFLKHTEVDSWANGFMVPPGYLAVYIVFWPQLLEWAGAFLGIFSLIFLLKRRS